MFTEAVCFITVMFTTKAVYLVNVIFTEAVCFSCCFVYGQSVF